MFLLIKGGDVIDPAGESQQAVDILIENGKILSIGPNLGLNLPAAGADVINTAGKLVLPGLVDMHVHLREPGYEAKETVATGALAAVRGGFTSVACMPNTDPIADNPAVIAYIISQARRAGRAKVYPVAAITRHSEGNELAPMAELKEAGAVAFSDDGQPVSSAVIMKRAMEYASMLGMPVISHCEDLSLAAGGVMHEGRVSTMLGLKGIPASAEEVMIARDVILAGETGCHLHIAHASTRGAVHIIRQAKALGIKVTAEVTPHHFTLTHAAVAGQGTNNDDMSSYDTNTKVNPPLRTAADVEAIKEGLADGTIDVIATDHAPHTAEEKDVEYDLAPFGLVGLETAVGLVWSHLVKPGILTPEQAVAKMTIHPSRILGLNAGTLQAGSAADITIIDPHQEWKVDRALFAGKSKNTPFAGHSLMGKVVATIVDGVLV